MKVFVAGATGAVGKPLVEQLVAAGHEVVGMTRSPGKQDAIRALGARPVVADALDADAVAQAVAQAEPDVIVHQLTAIAKFDMRNPDRAFATTNRLRTEGLDHLLAAGQAVGAKRFIAQSYAGWPYARTGGPVKDENDPLDPNPPAKIRETLKAIEYVEQTVPSIGWGVGIVLRYGGFYGPGTGAGGEEMIAPVRKRQFPIIGDGNGVWSFVHVDDAAAATVAAVDHGAAGIYNVVDDEPAPVREWLPGLAEALHAKPPRHIPRWIGRLLAGEAGTVMLTEIRGASNAKAKREFGWKPAHPTWRTGFPEVVG
jgi:nucleoside-diphosphate-sugar epimerase